MDTEKKEKRQKLSPPTVGTDMMSLVGSITVVWAAIEWGLEACIWRLVGGDIDTLVFLTGDMASRRKLDIIERAAREVVSDAAEREHLLSLVSEADALRIERNSFAHDMWFDLLEEDTLNRSEELFALQRKLRKNAQWGRTYTKMDLLKLIIRMWSLKAKLFEDWQKWQARSDA